MVVAYQEFASVFEIHDKMQGFFYKELTCSWVKSKVAKGNFNL